MGAVLDLLNEIEKTVQRLDAKQFTPDPIAGKNLSRITSVTSSAYKRHGYILERAVLEALKLCPYFEVWRDDKFHIPPAVHHIVDGSFAEELCAEVGDGMKG